LSGCSPAEPDAVSPDKNQYSRDHRWKNSCTAVAFPVKDGVAKRTISPGATTAVQLNTILNRVEPCKSLCTEKPNGRKARGDQRSKWKFMPARMARQSARAAAAEDRATTGCRTAVGVRALVGIAVYFVYAMRRVGCPDCGVTVERVPWAEGKCHSTTSYRWFLARWRSVCPGRKWRRSSTRIGETSSRR